MAFLVAVLIVLTACSGYSRGNHPIQPQFDEGEWPGPGGPDYRSTVRSAASNYVKVVIVGKQSSADRSGPESALNIVSGASGVIVNPCGYVVTAAHIAKSISLEGCVTTIDGDVYGARILHVDPEQEMALLKITTGGKRFSVIRPAAAVHAHQPVFAIGTPDNRPGAVAAGYVVKPRLGRTVRYGEFAFDAPMELALSVKPGFSGGPVFDGTGSLVGMIIAFDLSRRGDMNDISYTATAYAVPARALVEFARLWIRENGNN